HKAGIAASVDKAMDIVMLRDLGLELSQVEAMRDRRLALIAAKNWAEADRIRDELLAQGIQLKDGKDPATGERVTTWAATRCGQPASRAPPRGPRPRATPPPTKCSRRASSRRTASTPARACA